jgi:2-hydroxychromene-2-carboxylate isomerase
MTRQVEFFFDLGSPSAYLAWTQLPQLAADAGADIVWRPVLLGGVFKGTGNAFPATVPAKIGYALKDFARCAKRYGVAFTANPHFPINTVVHMRGAIAYLDTPLFSRYLAAMFHGIWVEQRNLNDPAVVAQVLTQAGLDAAEFEQRVNDVDVKEQLKKVTARAVERGVFGVPIFFVDDEMFFGQDRLDFVAEALARQKARATPQVIPHHGMA